MNMQTQCEKCGGKGKTMAAKCPHCRAKRVVSDSKQIQIDLIAKNTLVNPKAQAIPK